MAQQIPKNILLIKDRVGAAKPSVFNLPTGDFTYGKAPAQDAEGAGEVCSNWVSHEKSTVSATTTLDYIKYNKLKVGANRDAVRQPPSVKQREANGPDKSAPKVPAQFRDRAFGKSTRASTPVAQILDNPSVQNQGELLIAGGAERHTKKTQFKAGTTKAAEGHAAGSAARREAQKEVQRHHFCMKKFQNVQPTFKLPDRQRELAEAAAAAAAQAEADQAAAAEE